MAEQLYRVQHRSRILVNTDPQRRCYNGVNFSEEWQWTAWSDVDCPIPEPRKENRLKFWRELNDYAVSQRGENAFTEYRAIPITQQEQQAQ